MMGLSKPTENTGGTKPVAHNDTVFAQVLKLVPRHEFESLARKHKSGRMSRSMTRWGQFVAMGMAQLTGRCSLRDIVSNLAAQSCKLYHLGVGVVTRSSLARVNAEKPWEMYEELHGRLLGRCQAKAPGHGYKKSSSTGCRTGGHRAELDRVNGSPIPHLAHIEVKLVTRLACHWILPGSVLFQRVAGQVNSSTGHLGDAGL